MKEEYTGATLKESLRSVRAGSKAPFSASRASDDESGCPHLTGNKSGGFCRNLGGTAFLRPKADFSALGFFI